MPARGEEIEHALEEGVQLLELSAPVRFIVGEDSRVQGVELQRMELGEPDASGRRRAAVREESFCLSFPYPPEARRVRR